MEALHIEANDPSLEIRRNELGSRYLYKLKSYPAYINTLDDSEDQKYEESERSVKPTGATPPRAEGLVTEVWQRRKRKN